MQKQRKHSLQVKKPNLIISLKRENNIKISMYQ